MKLPILSGALTLLLLASSAQATLIYTFNSGSSVGSIPDGNPVGVTFGAAISDASGLAVSGLTVGLNISGGYDGNLYAYLVAPNGTMVILLNQPGVSGGNLFGASGAGMNITLQDGASDHGSIQSETSGSFLSGSYNAAGSLANFNGSAVNGTWELFFADLVSGGGTSTVNSWSLDITAVPEPVSLALPIFGTLLLTVSLARRLSPRRVDPVV